MSICNFWENFTNLTLLVETSSSSGAMPYGLGDHGPPLLSILATVNHFAAPV